MHLHLDNKISLLCQTCLQILVAVPPPHLAVFSGASEAIELLQRQRLSKMSDLQMNLQI